MKRRWLYGVYSGIALIAVLTGFLLYHRQTEIAMQERMHSNSSTLDMGIVYLPLNQRIADYYGLGVDSGVLVTQVVNGSLVDQAAIKVGDVIVSFNGVQIDTTAPLLGMLRSCPMGHSITLAVWSHGNIREVTLIHTGQ